MAKNLRALTDDELKFINDMYTFDVNDEYIVVSTKNRSLKTLHPIDKSFSIRTKLRRVTFSRDAIDLWLNEYKDKYSLIEVQAAINRLTVTFQELSPSQIEKQLELANKKLYSL